MTQAPQIAVGWVERSYTAARAAAPFLFLLVPGTGGAFAAEGLAALERWSSKRPVEFRQARQSRVDARTTAERVRHVRNAFDLNMSEVAALFGVSRPTAYAWLDGQEPHADTAGRILRLTQAADRFVALPKGSTTYLRQPLFDGASLLDRLRMQPDVSQEFAQIAQLAERAAATRTEPISIGKRLRPMEEGDPFSTPGTYEPS